MGRSGTSAGVRSTHEILGQEKKIGSQEISVDHMGRKERKKEKLSSFCSREGMTPICISSPLRNLFTEREREMKEGINCVGQIC